MRNAIPDLSGRRDVIRTRIAAPDGPEIVVLTPEADEDVGELECLHGEGMIQDGASLTHLPAANT